MGKQRKQKSSNGKGKGGNAKSSEDLISIDPARIRFQHSRIRPFFSGCGRSVTQTLQDIRDGRLQPEELPPIQVLVGPDDWYFSLNNRRLWVLKRCREEGLLKDNQVPVRVRAPKSNNELERYTIEKCALEAKFIREKQPKAKEINKQEEENDVHHDFDIEQLSPREGEEWD